MLLVQHGSDTVTNMVTVHRNPEFSFGASVASVGEITLNPKNLADAFIPSNSTVNWFDGADTVSTDQDEYTVTQTGLYFAEVTSSLFNCTTREQALVFILPAVDLGPGGSFCEGGELNAGTDSITRVSTVTYDWSKDDGGEFNPITGQNGATLTVNESGRYKVVVTYTTPGQSVTTEDEVELMVDNNFTLSLPDKETICSGDSILLDAGVNGTRYNWSGPDGHHSFHRQVVLCKRCRVLPPGC